MYRSTDAIGGWVIKKAMPDFKWLWSTASKLDSKFTFEHVRIKTCSESIAFFDGGAKEKGVVEDRFKKLMDHQWKTYTVEMKFNIIQDIFQTRVPEVLQWVLLFSFAVFHGGTDEAILADGAATVNRGQTYIMTMVSFALTMISRTLLRTRGRGWFHCRFRPFSTILGRPCPSPQRSPRCVEKFLESRRSRYFAFTAADAVPSVYHCMIHIGHRHELCRKYWTSTSTTALRPRQRSQHQSRAQSQKSSCRRRTLSLHVARP